MWTSTSLLSKEQCWSLPIISKNTGLILGEEVLDFNWRNGGWLFHIFVIFSPTIHSLGCWFLQLLPDGLLYNLCMSCWWGWGWPCDHGTIIIPFNPYLPHISSSSLLLFLVLFYLISPTPCWIRPETMVTWVRNCYVRSLFFSVHFFLHKATVLSHYVLKNLI